MKNKLIALLLACSAVSAGSFAATLMYDRDQFEKSLGYYHFSPQWLPTDVQTSSDGWWTAELARFQSNTYQGHSNAVFYVGPREAIALLELCKMNNVSVRPTMFGHAPWKEASLSVVPGLLAVWLLWRRREKKAHVQQLGCGKLHREQANAKPAQLTADADETRKAKAMAQVHVISARAEAKEFIRRL